MVALDCTPVRLPARTEEPVSIILEYRFFKYYHITQLFCVQWYFLVRPLDRTLTHERFDHIITMDFGHTPAQPFLFRTSLLTCMCTSLHFSLFRTLARGICQMKNL